MIGVATYGEINFANSPVPNHYSDYVLRYIKSERLDGDFTRMFFGRNISAAEAAIPVRSIPEFGDHTWPPILEQLRLVKDTSFPHSTAITNGSAVGLLNATRAYVREVYIPGAEEGTRFLYDEFIGSEKFAIPRYPVPGPNAVSYDFLGASGSFPKCLHDDIVLKTNRQERTFYQTGGTTSTSVTQGQSFPRTNFKKWAPYVISDKQAFKDGLFYRIRVRVYPPPKPKTIVR